ncbi:MAG: biopolymer transporter ExbD [Alphaproteobacteria bacterium]|jgi:biopolymer transport protein ExbD|nr:biopolymer transporter ExbD [Alphaproteobacteria bacterium]
MRGRTQRRPEEAEVNLTPMLDVVFILLIFFIVTAVFTKEQAIGLEPPPPPPPPDQPKQEIPTITIFVNQDGLIRVNGRVADIGAVRPNIERLKAENPESAVIIQAHPEAKSGLIVNIRDQAYSANASPVNIVLSAG